MANASPTRVAAMAAVQAIFDRYHLIANRTSFNGFDRHIMSNVKLLDAASEPTPTATFELTITENYANLNHVMHGGAAAVIFDMLTTVALGPLARPGYWDFLGGVTRTLNISYLKAIPVGTKIHIYSTVLQAGRTMAMISGRMTSPDDKIIYCVCEHHKVAVPTRKEHLTEEFEVEWDRVWRDEGRAVVEKGKL